MIAKTPQPPYYAVIFTTTRTAGDNGYGAMADRMVELAAEQEGFLGIDSAREDIGITVSYWESLDAIRKWKQNAEHLEAQRLGREKWYSDFMLRIAKVERDYGM
ncbi:MAG: JEMB protein [Gammaproteobacteria bacterium RIFCSPLOWO2_02_FULL_57_10]|nr:MAG: JEMB protein [Gammaproteobacteria bacterium RIFCSPLOWO2_02_FULL_57_10]